MRYFLSLLFLLAFSGICYAGAWTQPQGSGQVILTTGYYGTDQYFDNAGSKKSQPDYSQYALSPYVEYGLRDDLTIGTNLSLQYLTQNGYYHYGIADSEFFLRQRLWQGDGFVISAQPMIKLPSPTSSTRLPQIGSSTPDAGLTLSGGYGFSAYGQNHFLDLDAGYRHRFGRPHDQVNLSATAGIGLTSQLMLMPQLFATYRTAVPAATSGFLQSASNDYNLTRLQVSAVYKLTNDLSLQVGGFTTLDGRNTGGGSGALFGIWKSF